MNEAVFQVREKMRRWEEEKYHMQADQMCQTALKTLSSMGELMLLKHKITWEMKTSLEVILSESLHDKSGLYWLT